MTLQDLKGLNMTPANKLHAIIAVSNRHLITEAFLNKFNIDKESRYKLIKLIYDNDNNASRNVRYFKVIKEIPTDSKILDFLYFTKYSMVKCDAHGYHEVNYCKDVNNSRLKIDDKPNECDIKYICVSEIINKDFLRFLNKDDEVALAEIDNISSLSDLIKYICDYEFADVFEEVTEIEYKNAV